jgi:hypothetical protein
VTPVEPALDDDVDQLPRHLVQAPHLVAVPPAGAEAEGELDELGRPRVRVECRRDGLRQLLLETPPVGRRQRLDERHERLQRDPEPQHDPQHVPQRETTGHDLPQSPEGAERDGADQGALIREVPVRRRSGHPGPARDALQRGCAGPLAQQVESRAQQRDPVRGRVPPS